MVNDYIYYIALGVEFLISLAFVITSRVLARKNKDVNNTLESYEKEEEILSFLPKFIHEAEVLFGAGNGQAKLDFVLNKAHISCLENSIPFFKDVIVAKVEEILATPEKKEKEVVSYDETRN